MIQPKLSKNLKQCFILKDNNFKKNICALDGLIPLKFTMH